VTHFHCKYPPRISVRDYVGRIRRYSQCSSGCVVVALLYIDRLIKAWPEMTICPLNCHRLILTSLVVAVKFHDDTYYSNEMYSKVGGVQLRELNVLEAAFLKLLDWRLHVDPAEYQLYYDILRTAAEGAAAAAQTAPQQTPSPASA